MISSDLKTVLQKIHNERYTVISTQTHAKRKDVSADFTVEASIILEKKGEQKTIVTSEPDCILYISQLHNISKTDGEVLLAPIKNAEQYYQAGVFLIDENRSKA